MINFDPTCLPAINASLNATALVMLLIGYVNIRAGRRRAHAACMIAAFALSALFLIAYLTYHLGLPELERKFPGQGWVRPVYFFILITHIVLAAIVPPLAIWTLTRAVCGRFAAHRRLARWTLPIWLYVSLTGVLVYLMLYRFY
jgi:uncharacterized membrane protein YozB (DUF420 family)